ncbi:MAG: hypothetical protein G01um10148_982 [Parcubacteria group bacterium Gr01-1014_8]|nr:MAG: hypothetical protein G01um10148_982 [Parcubacteria group bacterium Gr01-1014_8]
MPFVLSLLMTAIVSGISSVHVAGFAGAREVWFGAWLWSWAVAFPALLLVMPIVRRIVAYIVEAPGQQESDKKMQ